MHNQCDWVHLRDDRPDDLMPDHDQHGADDDHKHGPYYDHKQADDDHNGAWMRACRVSSDDHDDNNLLSKLPYIRRRQNGNISNGTYSAADT